jgi:hypothetical protein
MPQGDSPHICSTQSQSSASSSSSSEATGLTGLIEVSDVLGQCRGPLKSIFNALELRQGTQKCDKVKVG